jgi:hypothetical protein
VTPVTITQVDPKLLHDSWPFISRGIQAIKKRVPSDFQLEDIYASIRNGSSLAYTVSRGDRQLGFFVVYIQQRPFSGKKELFLWAAWSIPLRERIEGDDVPDAVAHSLWHMREQAKAAGCDSIVHMSSRRGFEKFGFSVQSHTYRMPLS